MQALRVDCRYKVFDFCSTSGCRLTFRRSGVTGGGEDNERTLKMITRYRLTDERCPCLMYVIITLSDCRPYPFTGPRGSDFVDHMACLN